MSTLYTKVSTLSIPICVDAMELEAIGCSLHNVSTRGQKTVRINLKINPAIRREFHAVAELRGSTVSNLIHQFIVKTIREEKERDPSGFQEALERVSESEFLENSNQAGAGLQPKQYRPPKQQPPLIEYTGRMSDPEGIPGHLSREAKQDLLDAREHAREKKRKKREQQGG